MNKEKNYFKIMIINILITLLLFTYFFFFHNYGTITSDKTNCMNKFNCSTCENGYHYCKYVDESGEIIEGLKCPCEVENE